MNLFSFIKSQSYILIALSIIVSCIGFFIPMFRYYFAFEPHVFYPLELEWAIQQSILFQFIHKDILHLGLNAYFLYIAGPEVEARMSKNLFFMFFIFSTILIIIGLLFYARGVMTMGISGFCMALLAYLCADLWSIKHHRTNEFFILLFVNIFLGFIPGISFIGHLMGAIAGFSWWIIIKKLKLFSK